MILYGWMMSDKNPNNPERKKDRKSEVRGLSSRNRGRGPDALTTEAKSILAVLLFAVSWPVRFDDGWVTLDDFANSALYLGKQRDRESLKAAVRNGLRAIRALREGLLVEKRRTKARDAVTGRELKEMDRRLATPFSPTLQNWLLSNGGDLLDRELWGEFLTLEFRPIVSLNEIVAGLEETVVRTHLAAGRHDEAVQRVESALAAAKSPRERRPLALCHATILLRRGGGDDWVQAERILEELHRHPVELVDHFDRVTEARIRIGLAYCGFLLHIRKEGTATPKLRRKVEEVRNLLRDAGTMARDLSMSDRGQIMNLLGILFKWEAQVEKQMGKREDLYGKAELHLRQALTIWRAAHDSYGLEVALYNLGELAFSHYRLHLGSGEEDQIREALAWYEASAQYTQTLGVLSQWILDYAKVVECSALLIPHIARDGWSPECEELVAKARKYIEAAREVRLPKLSWQGKKLDAVERLLSETCNQYSPNRKD